MATTKVPALFRAAQRWGVAGVFFKGGRCKIVASGKKVTLLGTRR